MARSKHWRKASEGATTCPTTENVIGGASSNRWANPYREHQQVREGAGYERSGRMNDARSKFADSMSVVLIYVEHHRYLLGELESMRLDIHLESLRFTRASSEAMMDLSAALVSDDYQRDPAFAETFEQVTRPTKDLAMDLTAYLVDLRTEAQNLLLGDIFGYTAPRRQPEDPSVRVLRPGSIEDARERLREYHFPTTGVD